MEIPTTGFINIIKRFKMNKIKNYRWHMIALVCFITVINYLDRTALGIAAPTIMETTGITKEQYSWIVSAFQLAYTLGQPIMGFFIDTVGLKLSFAICAAIWGGDNGACLDRNMVRSGIYARPDGFQRSIGNSCGCKTASTWFPAKSVAWRQVYSIWAPHSARCLLHR